MNKVIRDGLVAVIYSPGFGAGWYSWHDIKELLFDPEVVAMIEAGQVEDRLDAYLQEKYPDRSITYDNPHIAWVPEGTQFRIKEYDGAESVVIYDPENYITA